VLVTTASDEATVLQGLHELKAAITEHIKNMRSQAAQEIEKFRTDESDVNLFS
jgi:hypothetical protein